MDDMDGNMIRHYDRARFSGTPNNKEALRHWLHISRDMKDEDTKEGNLVKNGIDDYAYPASYNPLPDGNSYPAWLKDTTGIRRKEIEREAKDTFGCLSITTETLED